MASPRGFEPLTCSLGGSRAIQLCHGDVVILSARDYTDTASSFHVKLLPDYKTKLYFAVSILYMGQYSSCCVLFRDLLTESFYLQFNIAKHHVAGKIKPLITVFG